MKRTVIRSTKEGIVEDTVNKVIPDTYDIGLLNNGIKNSKKQSEAYRSKLTTDVSVDVSMLEIGERLLLIKPIEVKPIHNLVIQDGMDVPSEYYTEHPYKGEVVNAGEIQNPLKVKRGDIVYYNPSYRHYEFRMNNETYVLLDAGSLIAKIRK